MVSGEIKLDRGLIDNLTKSKKNHACQQLYIIFYLEPNILPSKEFYCWAWMKQKWKLINFFKKSKCNLKYWSTTITLHQLLAEASVECLGNVNFLMQR